MLRWMKVIVLAAGALGVVAFFLPYLVFQVSKRDVSVTAYQIVVDPDAAQISAEPNPGCTYGTYDCPRERGTLIPYYFLTSIFSVVAGAVSIWRKRMSGWWGIMTLATSLFTLGCWLREINMYRPGHISHTGLGATLLGVSGLLALLPAIAVVYWREPDPKPLFRIRLPVARLIRR